MSSLIWLAVVLAVAVLAWRVGARRTGARYRSSLHALARDLREGEVPAAGRDDPDEVGQVREALGDGWTSAVGRREEAFMEALERIARYLHQRVELPLLRGLEEDDTSVREGAEEALGGVEDLEFFLEDPGGEVDSWNLTSLVQSVTREFTREWDATLRLQAPDQSVPVRLNGEALKDALFLVLHNAGHHGGGSDVEVLVEREGGEGVVRVRDRGPGFGEEGLQRAAEPFWTTDPAGLGLGLSHARRLVRALDGSLRISSAPGGGAEVEVRVPLAG